MKFEEALVELRKGKNISRFEWGSHKDFLDLTIKDILSEDWVLSENWKSLQKPGKTFDQVFEDFKLGKRIRRNGWDSSHYVSVNDLFLTMESILSNDWEVASE
jgi:hypothetical protein